MESAEGRINVTSGQFDETELSDHSNWREAWQNEDPDVPHGYLDCLAMLQAVSRTVAGPLAPAELEEARARFRAGTPCPVASLEDLARLIQLAIPDRMPAR